MALNLQDGFCSLNSVFMLWLALAESSLDLCLQCHYSSVWDWLTEMFVAILVSWILKHDGDKCIIIIIIIAVIIIDYPDLRLSGFQLIFHGASNNCVYLEGSVKWFLNLWLRC